MKIHAHCLLPTTLAGLLAFAATPMSADSPAEPTRVSTAARNAAAPDIEEVLHRMGQRWQLEAQNSAQFRERYAFTHRIITEKWADTGVLKERTEESVRHDPRLPTGEQPKNARRERRGPGYRVSDFEDAAAVFPRFDYRLAGSEDVNGRAAWVIEFQPKEPALPARGLKERFINAVAGRAWVDAEDHVAARLDLRLVREVGIVGGLVGNVRDCQVRFERRRTADGLWYTPQFSWHLEGRALFSRKHLTHREIKMDVERIE